MRQLTIKCQRAGYTGTKPNAKLSLKNRARLSANYTVAVKVPIVASANATLTLDHYMRLPTEQYHELDPKMIKPLGNNCFLLDVPKMEFFNIWVQPQVVTEVTTHSELSSPTSEEAHVLIKGLSCTLNGSPWIQQMKLNDKFDLHFLTKLTWKDPSLGNGSSNIKAVAANRNNSSNVEQRQAVITGALELEVLTEVIPPFNAFPVSLLESTCNTVLGGLTRTLLPIFVKKLAEDFKRWQVDEKYRQRREARM
jgi:hypothetical protein